MVEFLVEQLPEVTYFDAVSISGFKPRKAVVSVNLNGIENPPQRPFLPSPEGGDSSPFVFFMSLPLEIGVNEIILTFSENGVEESVSYVVERLDPTQVTQLEKIAVAVYVFQARFDLAQVQALSYFNQVSIFDSNNPTFFSQKMSRLFRGDILGNYKEIKGLIKESEIGNYFAFVNYDNTIEAIGVIAFYYKEFGATNIFVNYLAPALNLMFTNSLMNIYFGVDILGESPGSPAWYDAGWLCYSFLAMQNLQGTPYYNSIIDSWITVYINWRVTNLPVSQGWSQFHYYWVSAFYLVGLYKVADYLKNSVLLPQNTVILLFNEVVTALNQIKEDLKDTSKTSNRMWVDNGYSFMSPSTAVYAIAESYQDLIPEPNGLEGLINQVTSLSISENNNVNLFMPDIIYAGTLQNPWGSVSASMWLLWAWKSLANKNISNALSTYNSIKNQILNLDTDDDGCFAASTQNIYSENDYSFISFYFAHGLFV
ncbi:hypothetical protein IT568_06930 [bacterium]|nr:hypothetical protein [bacterium]